jgi:hypothetical protein
MSMNETMSIVRRRSTATLSSSSSVTTTNWPLPTS